MVHDLRSVLRVAQQRQGSAQRGYPGGTHPTCENGPRAGYAGHKRKRGSKVYMAVDTLGLLQAVHISPANAQERAPVVGERAVNHMSYAGRSPVR